LTASLRNEKIKEEPLYAKSDFSEIVLIGK
jgi:hypothetical protein